MTATTLFAVEPASVHRTVLSNGLKVLIKPDYSAPVVAIVTYVSAGYFDETDDVVGIAHVLEHMYFKGTPTRGVGEIAKQTKAVGGYLNAATIYDHTSYYTVLPASGFRQGLEVQADAYANSLIDSDELARELEVIIQEAKRKADNPGAVATETLYELLHDKHRIRRWRIGREPGLRALTRTAMLGFYRNFYHPGNTVLSIVGAVDPDDAMREVERLYGGLPGGTPTRTPGPAEEGTGGFRYRELAGDIGQSQLAMGWRVPGTLHVDTPALDLLAMVLGAGRASRLYRAVRERKLASAVSAYDYTPTEVGVFVIHAETPPATTRQAAIATWDQLRTVRDEGAGEYELTRAKRLYESRWVRRLEDMEGQANYLAEWEALGDWRLGDWYVERLLTTTGEQVVDVATRYLSPDQAGVLVYRPNGSEVVAEDAGAMLALLESAHPPALPASTPYQPSGTPPNVSRVRFEREEAGVRVYRAPSGLPILVRQKAGAPLVHAGVFALGGASEETDASGGLTTLMVRTAQKGTETRTALQIAEEAEVLGGSIGGTVGSDSFGWTISVPTAYAASAIALLADVAQHPTFESEALDTERAVAIADVIASRDDMFRYPMRLATQAAFHGHPYGVPATGTEESLRAIERSHVAVWHRERMFGSSASMVVGIVGSGDPDALAELAAREFADLGESRGPQLAAPEWPSGVTISAERREKAQTAIGLLFQGPSRSDTDRFAASMIASVASGLGGRFFDELRDKQSLCYTVTAFSSARRAAGTFGAYIATSPEKEAAARDGLLAQFRRLRDEPVSAEELERAQTYAVGVHAIQQQSGGSVLAEVVDSWLFGRLSDLATFEQSVRGVTAQRMQQLARKYFDPDRRVEGIVRGVGRTV
ncbi:MAG TPA: pitrilysin family protein [Gemmatimonadaceae bacterium]|nr:pitrilysin family protein [Gemmatimonadaceae bacterium]